MSPSKHDQMAASADAADAATTTDAATAADSGAAGTSTATISADAGANAAAGADADAATPLAFAPGRVGIVGLGLMGGSFAKALHEGGREVYAWNRTHATLELAMIDAVVDGELDDTTIGTCELIILAGYTEFCCEWLEQKAPLIAAGALVIDTMGVKRAICDRCFPIAADRPFTFIGCHPMAGTQYSGYAHARANMFKGAPLVVVPPEMDDFDRVDALERLKALLAPCEFGSFTLTTADYHDRQIAYTSQLAHVVSNAYVKSPQAQDHKGFSAGSYKDLTRVARLNAGMWTELFLDNDTYLSEEIGLLIEHLQEYKDAIDAHNASKLYDLLAEGDRLKKEAEARTRPSQAATRG